MPRSSRTIHTVTDSNLSHAWCHFGDLIICCKRTTGPLPLPLSIMIFRTGIVVGWSGSSRIYTLRQDTLSTIGLKNLFIPFRLSLTKGNAHKVSLILSLKHHCSEIAGLVNRLYHELHQQWRHLNHLIRPPQLRQQHQHHYVFHCHL